MRERIGDFLISKRFHTFLRCMKLIARLLMVIALCALIVIMAPYVTGEQEFEEIPLSLSQLESILCIVVLCYVMRKMP